MAAHRLVQALVGSRDSSMKIPCWVSSY